MVTYVVAFGFCRLATVAVGTNEFAGFCGLSAWDAVAETCADADVVVYGSGFVAGGGYDLLDGGCLAPRMTFWIKDYVVDLKEK